MATITTDDYVQLRESIEQEKQERIQQHQARLHDQNRLISFTTSTAARKLNLIATGDSWFDYPFPFPAKSDVVAQLKNMGGMAPELLSLAHHGEAAEDMLGVAKLDEFIQQLVNPKNGDFDAILFSGGGNDLAGDQFRLWLLDADPVKANPANGLNSSRVEAILQIVRAGYEDLIAARDKYKKGIPIFAHSYDFAIPDGRRVPCAGPWLKPSLLDRGWVVQSDGEVIVKTLLVEFAALLDSLAAVPANHLVHVRTQGTLNAVDWDNELHPTPNGFAKITAKFVDALSVSFPGRI